MFASCKLPATVDQPIQIDAKPNGLFERSNSHMLPYCSLCNDLDVLKFAANAAADLQLS